MEKRYDIENYFEELQSIVFDLGSCMSKLGFSGDDAPRAVFPSIVGRPKNPGVMVGMDAKDSFVGDEAHAKRGILNVERPVKQGIPRRWHDYEKLLHHCPYNELKITPEEHPFLVAQPPFLPQRKRKLIAETFFEVFNVPYFYLEVDSILSLYATGLETGISLDIGYDFTRVAAVFEGGLLPYTVIYENMGAKNFTKRFNKAFNERQQGDAQKELHRLSYRNNTVIRKGGAYVAKNYEEEMKKFTPYLYKYTYTDYSTYPNYRDKDVFFEVGREALLPEMFFSPAKFGMPSCRGIASLVHQCIRSCPKDLQKEVSDKISFSGSITSVKGFSERFQSDLQDINKEYSLCKTLKTKKSPQEYGYGDLPYYSVWIGGSIFSSLSTMKDFWISRRLYDEYGADVVVRRKCPNGSTVSPNRGIIWSTAKHLMFSKSNKWTALFILWCSIQEESAVYCVPTEVMFIILEYYQFCEKFIEFGDDEIDDEYQKYLVELKEKMAKYWA